MDESKKNEPEVEPETKSKKFGLDENEKTFLKQAATRRLESLEKWIDEREEKKKKNKKSYWKGALIFWGIVAVLAFTGLWKPILRKTVELFGPYPQVVKVQSHILTSGATATIVNRGKTGDIVITVTQGDKTWKFRKTMEENEVKDFALYPNGFESGAYQVDANPAWMEKKEGKD